VRRQISLDENDFEGAKSEQHIDDVIYGADDVYGAQY
jgi:hypothetical protein